MILKKDIYLTVVMPGFNEGKKIKENLLIVAEVLDAIVDNFEIIYVDDGSIDSSISEANKALKMDNRINIIEIKVNSGKGNALKRGVEKANGTHILFLDSDLDLSPCTIIDFIDIMQTQKADVVIGSKLHPNSKIFYPKVRQFMSFCYYLFLLVLFRLNVRDTQTGMKLFKAEILKPTMNKILVKRFAFDIEVLSIINRNNYKIVDAPVILEYGRTTRFGRIKIMDIINVFTDTLAIYYRLNIIKYYDD